MTFDNHTDSYLPIERIGVIPFQKSVGINLDLLIHMLTQISLNNNLHKHKILI